jgi:hypothetical protein
MWKKEREDAEVVMKVFEQGKNQRMLILFKINPGFFVHDSETIE